MNLEIENNKKEINNNTFSNELKKHLDKNSSKYSIDRFEGNFAVCENLETNEIVNIKSSLLPENCKEGSIIKLENNQYVLDEISTKEKQDEIKNMVNNLFKKK